MKKIIKYLFVLLFQIPWIKKRWADNFKTVESERIPWVPLSKPLAQCKVALITTGGVHLRTDYPFDMEDTSGDPSYRKIPSNISPSELMITHDYYNHQDADQDINLVFPIDVLRQYQQKNRIGPSTEFFYGFMGHIEEPHLSTLIEHTAKEVTAQLKEQEADIVFLVPA
ncbi:MAG: hypothetical protein HQM14_07650 [SAR324 cluster bacterium]|nr:hypothetical protein [SAR324 cluster bacterium]